MSAQFHTPSFGDEVFDLTDVEPMQTIEVPNVNRYNATSNQIMSGDDAKRGKVGVLTEPVKPSSAYALFFRDTVSAIKAQNPNTTFEDISKIVNSMWQVLDPAHKNVYNKKGEQAKKEYIKQITAYRNLQMRQQAAQEDASAINFEQVNAVQHPNFSPKSAQIASRPAVFTISRQGGDVASPQHDQQTVVMQNNVVYCNNANAPNNADNDNQQPQNTQISKETGSTQICIRENCNKRAVINPDWEDEYCSNECVVIHCRNVFNQWVRSNMEGQG